MPSDSRASYVYVPLDRDTRLRLMERARELGTNPLDLAAELLSAKLESDERASRARPN